MKYHINKNGKPAKCMAILKPCPYTEHFDNKEEAMAYVGQIEDSYIKHPKMVGEKIINPNSNGIEECLNFQDKSHFNGLHLTEDSFVILEGKNPTDEDFSKKIKYYIQSGFISKHNLEHFIERLPDDYLTKDDLYLAIKHYPDRTLRFLESSNNNITYTQEKYQQDLNVALTKHPEIKEVFNLYDYGRKSGLTTDEVLFNLNYEKSTILVDKNTILTTYTRNKGGYN